MRIFALIGSIAMLVLPFAYVSQSIGDAATVVTWMGLLWVDIESQVFGFQGGESGTFQLSWLEENGLYHSYFDPLFFVGVIVLITLIVNIGLSVVASEKKNKSVPGLILIIAGVLLLIIRLAALGEDDLSFYTKSSFLGTTFTYIEIPLGFIWGLIFGILDLKK